MRFQLPKTRFVDTVTLGDQLLKVGEETDELWFAAEDDESPERVAEEALHVYQAVETLLRIMEGQYGPGWLDDQLQCHIGNMTERGYYE